MKIGTGRARLVALNVAVAAAFSPTTCFAQIADQPTALQAVVVSAMRVEEPLADVLSSLTVITRKDIERSQAQTLADLLQGEAGFEFGRNGGPGAVTSVFMRGQDSINTAIFVDGIRAPVDQIGSLLVIDIPIQQIERFEGDIDRRRLGTSLAGRRQQQLEVACHRLSGIAEIGRLFPNVETGERLGGRESVAQSGIGR